MDLNLSYTFGAPNKWRLSRVPYRFSRKEASASLNRCRAELIGYIFVLYMVSRISFMFNLFFILFILFNN